MVEMIENAQMPLLPLHDVKHMLRINHDHDDAVIEALIKSATQMVENYTQRSLLKKTLRKKMDVTSEGIHQIPLSYPPIIHIENVEEHMGDMLTKPLKRYRFLNGSTPVVEFYAKNATCISVTYSCGYGAYPKEVDDTLKQAVMMCAKNLYDDQDFSLDLGTTKQGALMHLLSPYRVMQLV
jgi:uncharacterized phiE125 gp8 family phage protein